MIKTQIKIASPNHFANTLSVGMAYEFREGARIIGTGRIEFILNDKLKKSADKND